MRPDLIVEARRHLVDRGLEGRVLELRDLTATVAHEVVVVLAVGVGRLVARGAVAHLEPAHQPEPTLAGYEALVHELECLSVEELLARAEAKDIDGADAMKREQLIEKLTDAPGAKFGSAKNARWS